MDTIPSQCECGGQVEYWCCKDGEEAWKCTQCPSVYLRYIESSGG